MGSTLSSAASNLLVKQFGRFSFVGIINTAIGYTVIIAGVTFGFSPYESNFAGYLAGVVCSFFLNKTFVFASREHGAKRFGRFVVVFAVSYFMNLVVLHISLQVGAGDIAAQLWAGGCYLIVMFLLSRLWIFKK